jgi:hypothetical protein
MFSLFRLGCEHGYKYYEYPDMNKKMLAKRSLAKSGLVICYILQTSTVENCIIHH